MNAPFREWLDPAMLRNIKDDRVDMYQYIVDRAVPEPEKNEFRYIIIGAASAVLWVAIYVIWRAL